MSNRVNQFLSFRYVLARVLTVLLFAQCSVAWSLDPFRHSLQLEKRQTDPPPPDPPIPVIDGVQSTKRYIRAPARNQGAFWSGLPFPLTQSAAAAAGFQTLEQSVAPEILSHPDAQLDSPNSGQFWTWMSAGFSETLVEAGHTEVTVLLRAPNRLLTGPSDPFQDGRMGPNANWSLTEFPIMRQNNIRVMAMHPGENGRPGITRYEIWPNDEGHVWQRNWGGGEQQPEELQCGPGENSVLVTCQTAIDQDTFEVGCPSVPGSLEPPLGGGQCNYTVEASANPQVNTFSITNSLTTLAVRLLVTCFSATCGSGANPRPPRSVLSDATPAHRAAIAEAHPFEDAMAGY